VPARSDRAHNVPAPGTSLRILVSNLLRSTHRGQAPSGWRHDRSMSGENFLCCILLRLMAPAVGARWKRIRPEVGGFFESRSINWFSAATWSPAGALARHLADARSRGKSRSHGLWAHSELFEHGQTMLLCLSISAASRCNGSNSGLPCSDARSFALPLHRFLRFHRNLSNGLPWETLNFVLLLHRSSCEAFSTYI